MLWLTKSELPRNVATDKGVYEIASDFRTWIRVDCILQDKEIPNEGKLPFIAKILGISLMEFLNDSIGISEEIMRFYRCDKEEKDIESKTNGRRAYDFNYDSDLLYASFRQQYGINILKENMHWFEFMALFNALDENTVMAKAIRFRTQDTSNLKGKELEHANKLERYWRLPDEHSVNEKTPEEIEADLLKRCFGGNI